MLLELKRSGIGCHINGTYMGVVSYADDITLSCPSIWGLNDMLTICERFSVENSILLNKNKTIVLNLEVRLRKEKELSWIAQIYYGLIILYTLVII